MECFFCPDLNDAAAAVPTTNQFDMFAAPPPATFNGAGPPPVAFNGATFNNTAPPPQPMQAPQFAAQPPLSMQTSNPPWNNSAPPGQFSFIINQLNFM